MHKESMQVNATLQRCSEMDSMRRLYNIQLIQQRERIEKLKRKLQSYNQNIEKQESIFNNFVKYTDGFVSSVVAFLERFNYAKKLSILSSCARYCLVDNNDELNLVAMRGGNIGTSKRKKGKSKKIVNSKCKNTIVYNKTSFYMEENTNRKKNKKSKNTYKKELRKKFLHQTENIYNLYNPYDTIEVRDLYDIYRKQSLSVCSYEDYYIH
ncbi:conserved Plasmodium protein, unknown function [Plasmodium ovale curtisi]|uniref:Uncharacterized protein n=1 Tax=Plasmodium ovale curtisi TaxID=864141 RepID=A0A1A8W553_PLAOA|nr:conserved Plasmodium protein, unknown function [Plasmodium ovale curtisi]